MGRYIGPVEKLELIGPSPWLRADHEVPSGKVLRSPQRREIASPVDEQLVNATRGDNELDER
jgi:hypothetical protein